MVRVVVWGVSSSLSRDGGQCGGVAGACGEREVCGGGGNPARLLPAGAGTEEECECVEEECVVGGSSGGGGVNVREW